MSRENCEFPRELERWIRDFGAGALEPVSHLLYKNLEETAETICILTQICSIQIGGQKPYVSRKDLT